MTATVLFAVVRWASGTCSHHGERHDSPSFRHLSPVWRRRHFPGLQRRLHSPREAYWKAVVHAPRKVPVAIRETVEWERTRFVSEGVLAKVPKLNGANKDLHWPSGSEQGHSARALPIENYIENYIENSLLNYFSVLFAKSGINQIALDCKSRLLTTFNTSFGRYR